MQDVLDPQAIKQLLDGGAFAGQAPPQASQPPQQGGGPGIAQLFALLQALGIVPQAQPQTPAPEPKPVQPKKVAPKKSGGK